MSVCVACLPCHVLRQASASKAPALACVSCAQVMFASVHLEHDGFYPDHRVGAQGSVPGLKNIVSLPLRYGAGSSDFRTLVATYLLPSVADFKPDLILISAGFDGHRDDVQGNGGGLLLADQDYVCRLCFACVVALRWCCVQRPPADCGLRLSPRRGSPSSSFKLRISVPRFCPLLICRLPRPSCRFTLHSLRFCGSWQQGRASLLPLTVRARAGSNSFGAGRRVRGASRPRSRAQDAVEHQGLPAESAAAAAAAAACLWQLRACIK